MEIELTIGLPWTFFRPASMTSHLEVDHRTRLMSGSAAINLVNRSIAATPVDHALVHVDVDHLRTDLDLLGPPTELVS